mmetsp:Transcript_14075/g.16365  ORF Transcript_14075/g.16365 Transcript_14075/m.16365 type:complete len:557 (+) Transcript_14075:180-1850(+)
MSDDEDEYEYDSDASMEEDDQQDDDSNAYDYPSGSEEEEEIDDINVKLENEYYSAKDLREDDKDQAKETFENVIRMEKEALNDGNDDSDGTGDKVGQWTFKALKQLLKLKMRYGEYEEAKDDYRKLLQCISNPNIDGVSPNDVEKSINGMLDRVASLLQGKSKQMLQQNTPISLGKNDTPQNSLAKYVYDSTKNLFHPHCGSCPNERLWFKTNLKYGQLLYESKETAKLQTVIQDLLKSSNGSNNDSNMSSTSSTNLMEIYALQIQLYSRLKDNKKLREISSKAMKVQSGVPHPRTIALIQELGGKMHMASREFEAANHAFFQAFKSYDEAGDDARLRCLKYLVLASMLHASSINPFDSQEVRPFKKDPEIVAMTNLVDAFHNNEITTFEKIVNESGIMDDEFIREYLADLLRTIRMQVLENVIRPYTRISLDALSRELNGIPRKDVESLLVAAILSGKLDGRIDQVNGILLKNTDIHRGRMETDNDVGKADTSGGVRANKGEKDDMIPWGGNSISVSSCSAMEKLMEELESLTMAVTAANSKVVNHHLSTRMRVS